MAESEDFIFRPIEHGYYTLTDIKSGTIDLLDVAQANDAIDVKLHNETLYHQHYKCDG